jgi:uncharacterized protein YigA (DUF484 family)
MNSSSELQQDSIVESPQEIKTDNQITTDYLQEHPDFFNQQPALLASLEIPHKRGSAISLIERQVTLLREQNTQHKSQLSELINIAKENELSNQRMHKLTLSLLDSDGIDACEVILDEVLCDDFSVDAIALKLFIEPIDEQPDYLFIQAKSVLSNELNKLLTTRKPMCGFFKQLPLEELFENKSQNITSIAVIPLFVEKNNCFGALVLGSHNVRRFNGDMGTLFLDRLGEILSHKLHTFL